MFGCVRRRVGWFMAAAAWAGASRLAADEAPLPVAWELRDGVSFPESAYYDAESGFVFLSQMGGSDAVAKDGNGWISKLTPTGDVVVNKWAEGLDAPKGLRSHDGVLWVADIDRLVGLNIEDGSKAAEITFQGAKFLNDVACDPDGAVYVSDLLAGTIHVVRKNSPAEVFLEGEAVEHPNGLLFADGKLRIGGWGRDLQADFSTKVLGRLLEVDPETKALRPLTPEPLGNLDGVELDGSGGFVVTDWIAGKVLRVGRDGSSEVLATLPQGAADLAYLADKHLLIVPQMLENKVTAFTWAAPAEER